MWCFSRSKKRYDHVRTYRSIDAALEYLKNSNLVYVIGGGEIYRQTIDRADLLVITEVHNEYEGDTFFPEYRDDIGTTWEEISREQYKDFNIVEYKRK
ncbi:MAG: dihydrofolate reductase [Balneolaceae bacterium]|nr:dihydrofolate reductase [Balneolaceae bacterium]